MKRALVLGFALLLRTASLADAQQNGMIMHFNSGEDLYGFCTVPRSEGECIAYIEGVADVLGGGDRVGGNIACIASGANGYRLREVVVDFLETIPAETKKVGAARLVSMALAVKYPCP